MATTVGTAYVQILPSAQGIQNNIMNAMGGDVDKAGKSLGQRLGGGLSSGMKVAGAVAGAAIASATAASVALGKQSLENYKTYEQLVGGAQLMFGDAYGTVAKNAAEAYKFIQMSQNDYLRQVNGFATGLKTSLGGNEEAAADLAHRIVKAEADIVAATGNSREAVENAFNGIMRSNYTMLDNLQLGITPTKEGFETLIDTVNDWNKANGKATKYQMGNLADMQSALVDYVEMVGMANYAQMEGATTIEGSIASTKAAWSNLLTGLADDNADLDALITNMIDSALTTSKLLLPRITTIMGGITTLLQQALPQIVPILTQFITENTPLIADAGIQIFTALLTGFVSALPQLVEALPGIFESIGVAISENGEALKTAGVNLFLTMGHMINGALAGIGGYIQSHFGEWVAYAGYLANDFATTMGGAFKALAHEAGGWITDNIITPMSDAVANVVSIGRKIVDNIKSGISSAWDGLKTWFKNLFNSLFGNLKANITVSGKKGSVGAGEYATGLDYVPYDEFPAILHKGEAVLTASEAEVWRNGGSGMTINQYIQSVPQTPVQLAAATASQFELARWAI